MGWRMVFSTQTGCSVEWDISKAFRLIGSISKLDDTSDATTHPEERIEIEVTSETASLSLAKPCASIQTH